MHLDRQHPIPVYIQLKEMLRNQIEQGVYYSHQKLPSERDLCRDHDLSRMTARRALQELIEEGFAYTKVGKGTFVSDTPSIGLRVNGNSAKSSGNLINPFTEEPYQNQLIKQLLGFNVLGVEQTINEMLASHPLETVATQLFPQVIRDLEQQWFEEKISLLMLNYAITTLRFQLTAMVNAVGSHQNGPKILLGGAPGDQHELGLLLLALMLRRRGFTVVYLGPNVNITELHRLFDRIRPQLVCLSAATDQSAKNLAQFSQGIAAQTNGHGGNNGHLKQSLLAFGGVAFNQDPSLVSTISGLYLGQTIEGATTKIQQVLNVTQI